MKKLSLYCMLFFTIFFFGQTVFAKEKAHSLDHIVAIVNEEVILNSQLQHALAKTKRQLGDQSLSQAALTHQVLNQLININLQLQLAKTAGIQITDQELDNIISRIANQNHLSAAELYQHINEEGLSTNEYRQEIQDQVTIQKLQQQEVASKLSITPEEINAFLKSKAWQSNADKEYHVEDILIPLADNPSPEQIAAAKKQAEQVLTKLNQGQDFKQVARVESANSKALEGGDLGWRKLPEIPNAFTAQVTHMQVKEISRPIQTPNGFHIIRLANVRSTASQNIPDRKEIESLLLQQKLEEAVQSWLSKLRAQAFINTQPTLS